MSYGLSTTWEEEKVVDTSSSEPHDHVSVMREFHESDVEFKWPAKYGECSGNHCDISGDKIPLVWQKIISDKSNSSIDMYKAGDEFSFKKTFVVKTIRGIDSQKDRKLTANEVENMKGLRHTHVAALLGTFTFQARLSILIFPAACCDLHLFMKRMSEDFENDSDTASKHKDNDSQKVHSEPWPLTTHVKKKVQMLRGYFICLSRALSYLHISDVRHKDIKPENILVDESGSVILTDFGISRRFPKNTPHATNNEWKFTRKYASPEIMKDKNTLRDDQSDVFSLGCVFLEMATLLLRKTLNSFSDFYATTINDSSKEEAYYCNLGNVYTWIDHLRASRGFKPVHEYWQLGEVTKVQSFESSPDNHMAAALLDIRRMLDETPSVRPKSEVLWQPFQHISTMRCRDCDPRRPEDNWKPSISQQKDAQTGLNNRPFSHATEENHVTSREPSMSGDTGGTMHSTRNVPEGSFRRSGPGPSLSTNPRRYSSHGHVRTRSVPESPITQLNVKIREDRARGARSLSHILHTVKKEEIDPEETGPEIAQVSAHFLPAQVVHGTSTEFGCQISDDVEPTLPRQPQATKRGLLSRLAIQQDQRSRGPNQRRATRKDNPASESTDRTPSPHTRIIVYDVSQTMAYETSFASLKDRDPKQYPLPRLRQKVEIGDKADLIAKVDLRQLKRGTKIRRWIGDFPLIYVLNYAAQPLETVLGNSNPHLTER